jgi:deazaflavin-dependent oxidoreductase (nitroreductase family)
LSQNPKVSIQIKNQTIIASAQVAQSADRERLWSQLIQISPMYEKYRTSTPREIPVVMLRPASAK